MDNEFRTERATGFVRIVDRVERNTPNLPS